jgi:hypothetical protein
MLTISQQLHNDWPVHLSRILSSVTLTSIVRKDARKSREETAMGMDGRKWRETLSD